MQHLYAPWRDEYINGEKIEGCVFCHIAKSSEDEKNYVLYKDEHCFISMNLYPYTPGHIMVIPNKHTDSVEELDEDVWLHISLIVRKCVKMFKEELGYKGVNIGMNLGEAAGAGIPEHIHYHIVPRYQKDTNFITTIANTRVYSTNIDEMYQKLKDKINSYLI
jgi:diadenosine tetraphosphate (Ap4A) HIT family hydrolase